MNKISLIKIKFQEILDYVFGKRAEIEPPQPFISNFERNCETLKRAVAAFELKKRGGAR